jgi:uncharacterized damage-inducible protein DinB
MTKTESLSSRKGLLLRLIDESYNKTAWHGPNLRGSIRQVSAEQAVWRPRPGRHNIAEIALHCAYWKYTTRRRIRGDKRGSFPLKGSNWFSIPTRLSKQEWREYIALLDAEHVALRDAVAAMPEAKLFKPVNGKNELAHYVYSIAMHDTYHAGQIRVAKTLHKQATGR